MSDPEWKIIAPADRWRNPLSVGAEAVSPLLEVARRLDLAMTVDEALRKVYLDLPRPKSKPPKARPKGLVYPSGHVVPFAPSLSPAEAALYAPAGTGTPAPLVVAEPQARLSPHFTMGEFLPRDPQYKYARVAPALVEMLEELRHALGDHPITLTSSYRPPRYNASIGGASQSVHMDGLAADVYADNVPYSRLAAAAERVVGDRGGLGLYPNEGFVHVDLRGTRARW